MDLNDLMKQFTLIATVHEVELRGKRRFYWRMRLALWLYKTGAWVAGMGFEAKEQWAGHPE